MKNKKAIVTLAIGDKYLQSWKEDCESNWQEYSTKHGYDLICLDNPLDTSERAMKRSPSWQKCLILSQDFAEQYERIVWVDSDVIINTQTAPSIVDDVPLEKVGAVEMYCYSKPAGSIGQEELKRMYEFWNVAVINPTATDYYTKYGFADGFDSVVQAGVLVLSPASHRAILEKIYFEYEEKGGPEWQYEMRPLSYELLKANAIHWIDPRFNWFWNDSLFTTYPFLINPPRSRCFLASFTGKMGRLAGGLSVSQVRDVCLTAVFLNSYFLHFGGGLMADMKRLDTSIISWLDCKV